MFSRLTCSLRHRAPITATYNSSHISGVLLRASAYRAPPTWIIPHLVQVYTTILFLISAVRIGTVTATRYVASLYIYLSTLSTNPSAPTSSTIPLHPPPHTTGIIGWAQFGPLAVVGALVPLSIPRPFLVPTSNNMNETESPSPNTEETASYLSLLTLFYLDPIIWKAFRVPHLGVFPWPLHRNLLRSVSAM